MTTGLDIQMVCACLSVVSFEKKFQIWVAVLIKQGTDTVKCSPMVTLFYRMGPVCCLFICRLFTAVANTTESVASTSNTVKKWWIGKGLEGSGLGPILTYGSVVYVGSWGKPRKFPISPVGIQAYGFWTLELYRQMWILPYFPHHETYFLCKIYPQITLLLETGIRKLLNPKKKNYTIMRRVVIICRVVWFRKYGIHKIASSFWRCMHRASSCNMFTNQQDARISVIKLYFFIRCSTCFGLY